MVTTVRERDRYVHSCSRTVMSVREREELLSRSRTGLSHSRTPPAGRAAGKRPQRSAAERGECRRRREEPDIEHDDERRRRRRRRPREAAAAQLDAKARGERVLRDNEFGQFGTGTGTEVTTLPESGAGAQQLTGGATQAGAAMSAEEASRRGMEMQRALARRVWGKRAREEDEPERTVTRRATTSQYTPEQYHRASDRGIT